MITWSPSTCFCVIKTEAPSKNGSFKRRCRVHATTRNTTDVYQHNIANQERQETNEEIIAPSRIEDERITKLSESMKEEPQFFSQPTTVFEQVGIQAEQISTIGSPTTREPTGSLLLKMEQVRFPVVSETFEGMNGEVQFNLIVDPRVVGSGKRFTFRILVHNLTGNDRTERKISFEISQTRQSKNISYLVAIPKGAERARIELQAFTDKDFPASNVYNQEFRKLIPPDGNGNGNGQGTGRQEGFVQLATCRINFVLTESNLVILRNRHTVVITNPSTEKGTTSVQEVLARIEAGCDVPPDDGNGTDFTPNIFDKGIVALLAVAALMPRGKKR